jgi:hypothetical protein
MEEFAGDEVDKSNSSLSGSVQESFQIIKDQDNVMTGDVVEELSYLADEFTSRYSGNRINDTNSNRYKDHVFATYHHMEKEIIREENKTSSEIDKGNLFEDAIALVENIGKAIRNNLNDIAKHIAREKARGIDLVSAGASILSSALTQLAGDTLTAGTFTAASGIVHMYKETDKLSELIDWIQKAIN